MGWTMSPLFSWRSALCDSGLPPTTRHVALTLSLHMNERGGSCFPSQTTLARETGLNKDTVKVHLRSLANAGWLHRKVERDEARVGTRVYYSATVPQGVQNTVDETGGGAHDPTPSTVGAGAENPSPVGAHDPGRGGADNPCQEGVREDVREDVPQTPASGGRKRRGKQPPEPLTPLERADDFDAWWKSWPRKIGKLDAVAAWRVMLGHLPPLDQMIAASKAIEERTRRECTGDEQWERFIPHPSTWLRRGDYLDAPGPESVPVQVRRPCVLCGVSDPCPERCAGVTVGSIESVESECIWR